DDHPRRASADSPGCRVQRTETSRAIAKMKKGRTLAALGPKGFVYQQLRNDVPQVRPSHHEMCVLGCTGGNEPGHAICPADLGHDLQSAVLLALPDRLDQVERRFLQEPVGTVGRIKATESDARLGYEALSTIATGNSRDRAG